MSARPLRHWLDRADALGAEGRFFEAHEELEEGWKAASGAEKLLLQGLIQVAAGLHRLTLPGGRDGAAYLLERGLAKLRASAALLTPESLAALEAAVASARSAGRAPKSLRFGLRAR
ncbi:MAG: DUF309 domain-containing protein [Elusimicrobia bacterium]|nr:DUF309 domain-containing protein [Elusimicrobiota bacterium]